MARSHDPDSTRLDDAARAGWLYYVAGNTQDEIARKLGVSRQSAQRLVSLAISARLIKVRLDHPIARCMELSRGLRERFGLAVSEVVPNDPGSTSTTIGIAEAAAAQMERQLKSSHPIVMGMGSGRTLRAAIGQLPRMDCPQHRIVSLVGNIAPDGSASFYDVIIRIADVVKAPHYPMPLPVIATTQEERRLLIDQKPVRNIRDLAGQADVTFVGIGRLSDTAELLEDGFITRDELRALTKAGAVGEILGWAYDDTGQFIDGLTNDRVASVPLIPHPPRPVIGVAMGPAKTDAIRGALVGGLISGLITDETMAEALLR